MTDRDLREVWDEIAKQVDGDGPYLHLQVRGGQVPIGAIVRASDRRPGLLVRFHESEKRLLPKPAPGRGFTFERLIKVDSNTMGLPILLADPAHIELFAKMGADLVRETADAAHGEPTVLRVLRRIDLWRRFLQRHTAPLSGEACRGLFAELHVLNASVAIDGAETALTAWQGPERALHDFHFADGLVEVKSWTVASGGRIRVSHSSQVVVDTANPMHIVAVQLSVGGSTGTSLPEAISSLRNAFVGTLRFRFDEMLAQYGYVDAHAELYDSRMEVSRIDAFKVVPGFPHISPQTLPGGLTDVQYSIELGALEPFRTSNPHIEQR